MNKKILKWRLIPANAEDVDRLKRILRIPSIAAKILVGRGLGDPRVARLFLESHLNQLSDPSEIQGMDRAIDIIQEALQSGKRIAVIGDYDVDGITSTALMTYGLRYFGGEIFHFTPRRFEEGYGLSQAVIERAVKECNPELLIALDCGTNASAEIEWLQRHGIRVLVIDHHRATTTLNQNYTLVNPNAEKEPNPVHGIFCTAGLVFKFLHGLTKLRRKMGEKRARSFDLKKQLDLVTLATVADVVPLVGENRIFVRYGLKELQRPWRIGTKAIMRQSLTELTRPLIASDLSFRVCPRINASGRIADAALPVKMFLTDDPIAAEKMAKQLDEMNLERQRIESQITEEASSIVERQFPNSNSIVLFNDHWHTGVIGIVAGKLMQRYRKPCVVLSREPNGTAKGSGRCINGLNLVELLTKCSGLLGAWGGHPLAAGIGMPIENVNRFREIFEKTVTEALSAMDVPSDIGITDWLTIEDVNESIMKPLRQFEPYGQDNPQPIFGFRNVEFSSEPHIFGNNQQHFNFTLSDGNRTLHGVAWNRAQEIPLIPKRFNLAVKLHSTYWNGNRGIQLELVDFQPVDTPVEESK